MLGGRRVFVTTAVLTAPVAAGDVAGEDDEAGLIPFELPFGRDGDLGGGKGPRWSQVEDWRCYGVGGRKLTVEVSAWWCVERERFQLTRNGSERSVDGNDRRAVQRHRSRRDRLCKSDSCPET